MQTEELIGTGGFQGQPQYYGVIHFLDYSFLDDYSFPMKKLHHKIISHLFSRVVDIRIWWRENGATKVRVHVIETYSII
jgi:hypothetical protein